MVFAREPLAAAAAMSLIRFGQRTRPVESNPTATATASRLLQNNPNRVEFTVVNLGTQVVYISLANAVSSTNGIPLSPNGGVTVLIDEDGEEVAYDWFVISISGSQLLYVQEVLAD